MADTIQLTVSLEKTDPLIWRRLLIPDSITFFDLHHILQIAMGWKNSHLFEFLLDRYRIGFVDGGDDLSEGIADANLVTVDTLLTNVGLRFTYLYDFGDGWRHQVEVEKISKAEENLPSPLCLEGERNCPPEDCGGLHGFQNLLDILKDRTHPEYQDMYAWSGRYNPKKFNREKINKELPRFKSYMKHWKR